MAGAICRTLHTCVQCGNQFFPKRTDRTTCCSRQCGWALRRAKGDIARARRSAEPKPARPRLMRDCCICGEPVPGPAKACVGCRPEKDRRRAAKRNEDRVGPKPERKCKECARAFVSEYRDKKRTFCSEFCLRRHGRRVGKAKRRARLRSERVEAVDPIKVFERDRWRCQLCGVSTPRRLRGSCEPAAPELDHIVPLAQGGEHSYRNTQCACRTCNIAKSDRPLGQMRLFG